MPSRFVRALTSLELEERILNGSILISLIGIFLPWISGEWLGSERTTYNGLGFFTSFLGFGVLLIDIFLLLIVLVPLLGGPVLLRRRIREPVRLFLTIQSTILVLASLSVLTKITFESSRMEVRFGIYCSLIGGLVSALYAFLIVQQAQRDIPQEVFHHPEDTQAPAERRESAFTPPPPPPPPPPLQPEEHRLRT